MPLNSRAKGARAEREVRDLFRDKGFTGARRGQQFAGGTDSPDVLIPELAWLHVESKAVQNLNFRKAMEQAVRDAGPNKVPTVFHKRNHEGWTVTMRVDDWFKLLQGYLNQCSCR